MREIKYIVIHCTATSRYTKVQSILNYWKDVLKWKNPGYHFLIDYKGVTHSLLSIDKIANGVAGYNSNSIHISYIGGVDSKGKALDTRSESQKVEMLRNITRLKSMFPSAIIKGHRDFPNVKKECPSFDVATWLKSVGI